ncbi:MAG: DUF2058 family protein [Alphaproteobacteria bacterium]|nr:DUF2058 family protein [Alphaproteobacteria bacterium]
MSLRDALLKSGAASKKQAQAAERQARQDRNQKKGNRKKKKALEAEQAAAAAAQDEAAFAERVAVRRALRDAQEAAARTHRARQLIRQHGLEGLRGGPVRFHHRGLRGEGLRSLQLSWSVARALREGHMAIAGLTHPFSDQIEYWVVPMHVAERLREVQPEALVFHNAEPPGDDPTERFIDEDCPRTPWDGEGPFRWSQPELAARWG